MWRNGGQTEPIAQQGRSGACGMTAAGQQLPPANDGLSLGTGTQIARPLFSEASDESTNLCDRRRTLRITEAKAERNSCFRAQQSPFASRPRKSLLRHPQTEFDARAPAQGQGLVAKRGLRRFDVCA